MALVISPSGSIRQVKNLGWLINNWRGVHSFSVTRLLKDRYGARLVAHMDDGRIYVTDFVSRQVLACWLNRPVFQGTEVVWFGKSRRVESRLCQEEGPGQAWAKAFSR